MYLTGFADEAAPDIDGQIKATQTLGWKNIESRNVNGTNIHDLSDTDFDVVYGKLQDSGITINCFGSAIANWGQSIEAPFEETLTVVERAIPRMKKLGTSLIRIMSYAIMKDREPDDQIEEERFKRLRVLHSMFTDEGIEPVHENCMNYGGMGWPFTLRLLENVPGLKLVFDTANPIFSPDRSQPKPCPRQSSWDFYSHVKDHIAYMHIKDARFVSDDDPEAVFPQAEHFFPGDGDGEVKRTLTDLLAGGYDGGISIEPHMSVVFHDESVEAKAEARVQNYIEYGKRIAALLDEITHNQ